MLMVLWLLQIPQRAEVFLSHNMSPWVKILYMGSIEKGFKYTIENQGGGREGGAKFVDGNSGLSEKGVEVIY